MLRLDIGTELGSLDRFFDGSNYGKLGGLFLLGSLGSTHGKAIGSDKGIKMGSTAGKVLGIILGDVDVIALRIDFRTELVSLDGSFDGYNYENLENLLLGNSLKSTRGKVLGSD